MRGLLFAQTKRVNRAWTCLKYERGTLIGRAWNRYKYFGNMLIFNRLHLTNHKCRPLCHLSSSIRVLANGGKLCSYIREKSEEIFVPRYFNVDFIHLKWKLDCIAEITCGGNADPWPQTWRN